MVMFLIIDGFINVGKWIEKN